MSSRVDSVAARSTKLTRALMNILKRPISLTWEHIEEESLWVASPSPSQQNVYKLPLIPYLSRHPRSNVPGPPTTLRMYWMGRDLSRERSMRTHKSRKSSTQANFCSQSASCHRTGTRNLVSTSARLWLRWSRLLWITWSPRKAKSRSRPEAR
jgi:hypothetical protein